MSVYCSKSVYLDFWSNHHYTWVRSKEDQGSVIHFFRILLKAHISFYTPLNTALQEYLRCSAVDDTGCSKYKVLITIKTHFINIFQNVKWYYWSIQLTSFGTCFEPKSELHCIETSNNTSKYRQCLLLVHAGFKATRAISQKLISLNRVARTWNK